MIVIPCPHCGPRNEDEFVCWSEVVPRPADPAALSDAEWTDYVYNHANPKGWVREQWRHERGCRRWIIVERNTLTHEVAGAEITSFISRR